jgi:uncharacterized integral membrane protein
MRYVLAGILLPFLGAVGVFAVQNTQTVTARFLNWSLTAPLALMAVAIYLLGMLSGWTVVGFLRRSIRSVTAEPRE